MAEKRDDPSWFDLSNRERLVCQLVADRHPTNVDPREVSRLVRDPGSFQFCQDNEIVPHVYHAIHEYFPKVDIPEPWQRVHEETRYRLEAYLAEAERVASLLDSQSIRVIALKNVGIAHGIHDCLGCSPMGDIDLLVERRCFRRAHELLLEQGYVFKFRSPLEDEDPDHAEASGGGEYRTQLDDGQPLWLELQWRPVAGRWIRPDQEPTAEELFDNATEIGESKLKILSPEDNLLQVSLHTAKHSYVRAPGFRLHTDVDRIVTRQRVDWAKFIQRVTALQVKTAAFWSLSIPAQVFQTPIPEEVLDQLRPPAWKRGVVRMFFRKAHLFDPNKRKFSRLGFIGFTAFLYDDMRGLWRGMFPSRSWMRQRYGKCGLVRLASLYLIRLWELTTGRLQT